MNLGSLKENIGLKLLALALGTTLWIFVQSLESAKSTKTFQVPLRIDASNPDIAFVSVDGRPTRTINVTMKGLAEELAELDTAKVQKSLIAWVDLSQGDAGEYNYPVHVRWAPEYGKYSWEWERRVNVLTEKLERVSRPITVITTGATPAGMDYGDSSITPSIIEIIGPESKVAMVATVRVLLDLQKAQSGVLQSIAVEALDANEKPVEGVVSSPPSVEVRPVLTPASPWREVFVAPLFSGSPAPGYRVTGYTVEPEVVRIQGDPRALRLQGTLQTTPVDVTNLTSNIQRTVDVSLPRGLKLRASTRIRVRVTIEADPNAPPPPSTTGQ